MVETTVVHTTGIVSGKEYPLTITKQRGYQEIELDGEIVPVTAVTFLEWPFGTTRCYTRAQPEKSPEEQAETLRRIKEVAIQAALDQGLW